MESKMFYSRQLVIADLSDCMRALPPSLRPRAVLLTAWPGFEIPDEALYPLLEALIRREAEWFVCVGTQSARLHDLIDRHIVLNVKDLRLVEDRTIATTWHDCEPLEKAVDFFLFTVEMQDWDDRSHLAILNLDAPQDAQIGALLRARC